MILYKYVPFLTGRQVLESGRVRFSDARSFNDPFDTPTYPGEEIENPFEAMIAGLQLQLKQSIWASNTGILSLTRTPSNPLMWAHYAEQHRGMVLGFDVRKAGFADPETNVIPAQYGSVIYVSARPGYDFVSEFGEPLGVGSTYSFEPTHYEKLQRVFLLKALYWAYEEEVRVLKCIKEDEPGEYETPSGKFTVIGPSSNEQLRLYELPAEAICEVYFGIRSGVFESTDVYDVARRRYPDAKFFECKLDKDALSVGVEPFTPEYP